MDMNQVPAASQDRYAALLTARALRERMLAQQKAANPVDAGLLNLDEQRQMQELNGQGGFGESAVAPDAAALQALGKNQVPGMSPADFMGRLRQNPNLMNFQTPDNMRSGPGMY